MPYTKMITVYDYDELSNASKDMALVRLGEGFDYWGSDNTNTLEAFEKIFPVKVGRWEYGYCRPWIENYFTGGDDVAQLSGIRLLKYLWNNYRFDLYKGKYYSKYFDGHHKSRNSKIQLDDSCVLTGFCIDDAILQPIYDFMAKPDSRTFEELMSDCLYAWVKACSDDYDAWYGEENLLDMAEYNNIGFDEYGNLI